MPKVILGVLLLVLPFIGRASTIPSISATALLGNGVGDTISQPGTLSFSFSGPISFNNGTFLYSGPGFYNASADASYGNVTANANAGCGGDEVGNTGDICNGFAMAGFLDSITILNGSSGILSVTFSLTSAPFADYGFASSEFSIGSTAAEILGLQALSGCSNSSTCTIQQNFTAGVAVPFGADVEAIAQNPPVPGTESDFASAQLLSIDVLSSAGQPITGFEYTTASQTPYAVNGGTFVAPEPAVAALVAFGFALFLCLRGGRRRGGPEK
jgi:hypothetical protein